MFSRDCCEYHLRTTSGEQARRARQPLQVEGLQRARRPPRRRTPTTPGRSRGRDLPRPARRAASMRVAIVGRPQRHARQRAAGAAAAGHRPARHQHARRRSTSDHVEARSRAATRPASSTTCCCHRRCSSAPPAAPCSAKASGTAHAPTTPGSCTNADRRGPRGQRPRRHLRRRRPHDRWTACTRGRSRTRIGRSGLAPSADGNWARPKAARQPLGNLRLSSEMPTPARCGPSRRRRLGGRRA